LIALGLRVYKTPDLQAGYMKAMNLFINASKSLAKRVGPYMTQHLARAGWNLAILSVSGRRP
ncbi:hypothetical protein, partial [Shewanella litoralis]|uniref:hypothetical protein n=1 Tax=Shewanella litoralis TaxID=2282700 RepID=UPI00197F78D3